MPLSEAELSDRQKVAVVLQVGGLSALCELAGWRIRSDLRQARVDPAGLLSSVAVEPGDDTESAGTRLRELLQSLFRSAGEIAGRGSARRSARELLKRWQGAADAIRSDRALRDLLEAAPFLSRPEFEPARAALAGGWIRDGVSSEWRFTEAVSGGADRSYGFDGKGSADRSAGSAGGQVAEASAHRGSFADLEASIASGRWRQAARWVRAHRELAARHPIESARALFAIGKLEQALFVLTGIADAAAETLRAECQSELGELGAARESIRRLEASGLSVEERLAASDVVLRVFGRRSEWDAARDWAAASVARARGKKRVTARLYAGLAALDRGEYELAERFAAEATAGLGEDEDARSAAVRTELELQLAMARSDGEAAEPLARRRLADRRRLPLIAAGRAWSNLGFARADRHDFFGAERAYAHARRLLLGADGPLAVTLAGSNLADVRLRLGKLRGVDEILEASAAHNRRSGNLGGELEDELLFARRDLVVGDWQRAAERCRLARARAESAGNRDLPGRLAAIEARALGWLGQAAAAREAIGAAGSGLEKELEPEEWAPALALAGETDRALESARASTLSALLEPLAAGTPPSPERWHALDRLQPFRRARCVLDAELLAPGSAPPQRRLEAAALFRRLGASRAGAVCERSEAIGWQALGRFFERPTGDRAAIEELFAAIGHAEAELLSVDDSGERRLAGAGGRALEAERTAPFGGGELVLRATEIDEPLRALFALFLRDLPAPAGAERDDPDSSMAGESSVLLAAVERLRRFAESELPVLILGENGTGKELAAALVHRASTRRRGPWVPVNCAGLSETLLLSELFGHARGAFTGADQARAGVFETARGGTVFLDEIGDLPLPAQGSLLRVLQEREIRRLGESLPRKVDARVVAATHRDLEAMVEQGRFRQDLYFRLKVALVSLPPLRERGGDLLLLAERFLETLRVERPNLRLTPEARRALQAHSWPGNVRELKNALESAAVLAADQRIGPEHLDLDSRRVTNDEGDYHRMVEAYRRRLIEGALEASEGSLAGAARQLGVTRQFLSQFVRKFGLDIRR